MVSFFGGGGGRQTPIQKVQVKKKKEREFLYIYTQSNQRKPSAVTFLIQLYLLAKGRQHSSKRSCEAEAGMMLPSTPTRSSRVPRQNSVEL